MENMEIVDVIFIAAAFLSLLIIIAFYALNKKLNKIMQPSQLPKGVQPSETGKQIIPVKIQAYERMILYVERIELEGLVMRVFIPEMTVQQLQAALNRTIREEFEHNLTQQLYVSELAWEQVKAARETILSLIGEAYTHLAPDDNGMELAKLLFSYTQDSEIYAFNNYSLIIKREMNRELR